MIVNQTWTRLSKVVEEKGMLEYYEEKDALFFQGIMSVSGAGIEWSDIRARLQVAWCR